MKVFKRNVNLSNLLSETKTFILVVARALYFFQNPLQLLSDYIKPTSHRSKVIGLRNGFRIFLSSHKSDVITVVLVFCKKDYGDIQKGDIVVDIGATLEYFRCMQPIWALQKSMLLNRTKKPMSV